MNTFSTTHKLHLVLILILCPATSLRLLGDEPYPEPIPYGEIALRLESFANIPDSSPDTPARMSLMTSDPNGRLFINDQSGPLYTVSKLGDQVTEYLDLRDYAELSIRTDKRETGFQSFAFHPDFLQAGSAGFGLFYTMHSSSNVLPSPDFDPGGETLFHSVLLEWKTNSPNASSFIPADALQPYRELLRLKQPGVWHNAGLIAFNPTVQAADADYGYLYIGVGDGLYDVPADSLGHGQNMGTPYGALLRINPLGNNSANGKYGIAQGNIFASDQDPTTLAEIYAYGFRNPQRFSWDYKTGDLYLADIGENTMEELNRVENGGNYGWSILEGSLAYAGGDTTDLIGPIAEYDHLNLVEAVPTPISRRAISTGEVQRNHRLTDLNGHLIFSDIVTGLIFALNVDSDPLDGGQDGIRELRLVDEQGATVRLLDAVQSARVSRGLPSINRADCRFSIGIRSGLYVLNKHDGVLRRLVPLSPLSLEIHNGSVRLDYYETLESSSDLSAFSPVSPQTKSPWIIEANQDSHFFRTVDSTRSIEKGD